ncbi:MOSC N-terminal beta barrel [Penicillium sp. IBT 16267x]|nr:MOSC N-terminal beta barrel [Penicillium sp. IBT 16267x]
MIESVPTASVLVLGLVLLLPILVFPQLKRWIHKSSPSASLLPRLRLWNRRPKHSSEIVSLRVYPIKSCRGFEVHQTTLREHGLDLDRRWMLVDASTNEFLTIRQIPNMTRIGTGLSADGKDLVVTIPSPTSSPPGPTHQPDTDPDTTKTIRIPAHPTQEWLQTHTTVAPVNIWGIDTDGYIYNDEINSSFSEFMGRPVALVYKGPTPRVLKGNGAPELLGRVQTTGFPDVLPVLIASEASLAELNTRLSLKGVDPITVERFRPNIVVRGDTAWSEDSWKLVRIRAGNGSNPDTKATQAPLVLDIVARCARCQVPNVDPDSAIQHKKQPWDTLVSYRRVDEGMKYKPCFGMLSAPRNEGAIEVGMVLEVVEETTEHRYIAGF